MVRVMLQPDLSKLVFKQCALCASISELQASHIIPRFVFDWLRDTSATGHFRSSQIPDLRVQDGLKPRMLCKSCEQLFSTWEKAFAEKCFVPLNSGNVRDVRYGLWMLKFATSVSWRVLRLFAANDGLAGFPDHIMTEIDDTLREWSLFLLGDRPHPGRHEQHMFVADVVEHASVANMPPNISRYLAREIDAYVAHIQDSPITYAKMGKFVLFGFIAMEHPRRWKGTKLHVRHGLFGQRDIELPSDLRDFIFARARLMAEKYSQISEKQHANIRESYEKDPDRAAQSETLRAMHHDVSMFGKSAFEATQTGTLKRTKKSEN